VGFKEAQMKISKYSIAVAAVLLLLPFGAFARSKDSGSLSLSNPTKLGSTELKPGTYKVQWTGTADNTSVNVLQQNKTVATSQAKLVELPKPSSQNSVQTDTITNQIQQIDFSGQRDALIILPKS
jgi:hypothetical protein